MFIRKFVSALFIIFAFCLRAEAIKIGIEPEAKEIKIASSVSAVIYDANKNKLLYEIRPRKFYSFKQKNGYIFVNIDRREINLNTNNVLIKTKTAGFLCEKRTWYRGDFLIQYRGGKTLTLINKLPLEDYLKGVVPAEMPSKWNTEALKAQAIAARSYAVATAVAGKHGSKGYHLLNTTADQAYGGASAEKTSTTKAVNDTKGLVLVQNKKVIPTYYHASSGGKTKVWASGSSFLKSVPSYDNGVRKNGHGAGMSQYGANNLAEKGYSAYQILDYFYKDFKFAKLSENWDL